MPLPKTLCSALLEAQGDPWGAPAQRRTPHSSVCQSTHHLLPQEGFGLPIGNADHPHHQPQRGVSQLGMRTPPPQTHLVSKKKKSPMQSAGRSICEDGLILTIERC